MAIDRTGISSLRGDAPNLRLEGDVAEIKSIPIDIQKMILQYWIQQGDGSPADRIEDVPKEFRDRILQLFKKASAEEAPAGYDEYRLNELKNQRLPVPPEWWNKEIEMASAPDPMEMLDTMALNEFGKLWKDLTNEEKDWLQEIGHEEGRAPVEKRGIMQAAYGGTARPTYTQSRKQRINAAGGGIMGSNAGSMLVAPTADGSRPGYGILGDIWEGAKDIGANLVPYVAPVIDWGKRQLGIGDTPDQPYEYDYPPEETWQTPPYIPSENRSYDINPIGWPGPGAGKPEATGKDYGPYSTTPIFTPPTFPTSEQWVKDIFGGAPISLPSQTDPTFPSFPNWDPSGPGGEGQEYGGMDPTHPALEDTYGLPSVWENVLGTGQKALNTVLGTDFGGEGAFNIPSGLKPYIPHTTVKEDASGVKRHVTEWKVNPLYPIMAGVGVGEYTRRNPGEAGPVDLSRVNIPQTGKIAYDDPKLRFKPKEQYVDTMAMAAKGGRIGAFNGGIQGLMPRRGRVVHPGGYAGDTDFQSWAKRKHIDLNALNATDFQNAIDRWNDERPQHLPQKAQGGRIGYDDGKLVAGVDTPAIDLEDLPVLLNDFFEEHGRKPISMDELKRFRRDHPADDPGYFEGAQGGISQLVKPGAGRPGYGGGEIYHKLLEEEMAKIAELKDIHVSDLSDKDYEKAGDRAYKRYGSGDWGGAQGGRARAQEGGLMDLGGMEKDYRQEGGFVPIGGQEKADDVPARLSKNEFVFTADAVRAAGGGDIDKGAAVMERLMDNLEAGGKVSEKSQGLEGARGMFANAQQLEKRII